MGIAIGIFILLLVAGIAFWAYQRPKEEPPRLIDLELPGPKPTRMLAPTPEAPSSLEPAGASPPRLQHYLFGHVILRQTALADPRALPGFMAMARDGVVDGLLGRMWGTAADMARAEGNHEPIPGGPPRARLLPDGVLIQMPPPRGRTECLYIAVLGGPGGVRYFTLEMAGPPCETPFMLCEWTPEVHANMGPFPGPTTEEAFLANVRPRLARG